jgi:hypothetical protein
MLSLAQHADYAQHLSVYAVSCTVINEINQGQKKIYVCLLSHVKKIYDWSVGIKFFYYRQNRK